MSIPGFLDDNLLTYENYNESDFDSFSPHVAVVQTPYERIQRRTHLYVTRLKSKGIRAIYIPYGIEITDTPNSRRAHFRETVIRSAWRIYTLSNEFVAEYKKYCPNYPAVRGLGLPRFDILTQKYRFKLSDDIIEKSKNRKIVVWHAHFVKIIDFNNGYHQVTPYLDEYIAFAKGISKLDDLFFMFLPHHKFEYDTKDETLNEKINELMNILRSTKNIFIDQDADYRPTLLNADAIITDRSALMIESAVVGVPVLYLTNPDYKEPTFPPLITITDSYYQGSGNQDMLNFIQMLQNGVDPRKSLREDAVRRSLPCLDGKCGERIKDDIITSLLYEPEEIYKPKRLILFGTGQIFKILMGYYRFPDTCEVIALSDNSPDKWYTEINGITCVPPNELIHLDFDKVIIMTDTEFEEQIHRQLRYDLEIPETKIECFEYLSII
jgi:hypothetical protein